MTKSERARVLDVVDGLDDDALLALTLIAEAFAKRIPAKPRRGSRIAK